MKPRKLQLDHLAPTRHPRWPGNALLAISLAIAAELTQRYHEAEAELERLAAAQGLVAAPRTAALRQSKQRVDDSVKEVEAVMGQLTLPWGQLIETIENTGSNDVAILQLQPDAQQRVLRITGEARNQGAMVDYLKRLAGARGFAYVHLLSHQVQQDDPHQPVQFAAQASFKGLP